jgi:hypothetical protein
MKPEIDWTSLARQTLPSGQHPKTWPAWGCPRADGREVDLETMHQFYLYRGDLLGSMRHPRERLTQVEEEAARLHPWYKASPVIIPPVLLEYSLPNMVLPSIPPEGFLGPVSLPRVAVIAELRSHRQARDPTCCFSSLLVIWFQETFGDASAETMSKIASLDWDALAFDWTP